MSQNGMTSVVPGQATVHNIDARKASGEPQKGLAWYQKLIFSPDLEKKGESLLEQIQETVGMERKNKTLATGVVPDSRVYYHPEASDHPWFDRAYSGIDPDDSTQCLVLVQDKVNRDDFGKACKHLNLAAETLKAASRDQIKHILLIVNVIGATESTRAQKELKWPYILIRGEEEVRQFYSVNFADQAWYAHQRHLISLGGKS